MATADSPDAGPIRQIADALITELEGRLGGAITLVAPTYILLDHRDLELGTAYTWADPGDCQQNAMATCTIHLSAVSTDWWTKYLTTPEHHPGRDRHRHRHLLVRHLDARDAQPVRDR